MDQNHAKEKASQAGKKEQVEQCAHGGLFFPGSGGLTHLIMLRSFHAFFDQSLIVAPPLVVLIGAGGHRHFAALRTRHRIPAFGFGRRLKRRLFRICVRFPRQFPLGLFPIGLGRLRAERPLMRASSSARSRTMLRVTVPMPVECSVNRPVFSGFVIMSSQSLSV